MDRDMTDAPASRGDMQAPGFIGYHAGTAPSPFYTALVAARTDRAAAQSAALAFIDGQPPYHDGFVAGFAHLPGPVRDFPRIAASYRQPFKDAVVWQDRLQAEIRRLLADHGMADSHFTDPAYLAGIDRLWMSYFALVALLGHDRNLLADIESALWLAHAITMAVDLPGGSGTAASLTPAQLSSIVNAMIVLPPEIFPLAPAQ